ncbi:uncharacterized protein Z519_07235 [Cladophialophora bantiana CBS 173.52]|uniref:CCHC-type domain-containing protein n=1 Tax=Cladophialophora bantiana (strain ATCC 10958 / CBS 173.52 / CDC B-1940 / NIH 8579) TaxID=1442370 RepID=A0A0D2EQL5_CLAB1|nr:uncharacterized protein Z519_07235 [Cladophialophora bantiana CBS 173.52]KIW92251.1 hypothetical protein Z519_07235 [Cladophialophora bantiana CBS 173.52]
MSFPIQMSGLASSDDEGESRIAAVGLSREARQKGQVNSVPFPSTDSSIASHSSTMGNTASQDVGPSSREKPEELGSSTGEAVGIASSASAAFGNNRLATGFHTAPPPAASHKSQSSPSEGDGPFDPETTSGESRDDAIEISDDEQEESDDGGMVINIDRTQHHSFSDDMDLDDDGKEEEQEGEEGEEDEEEEEEKEEETFTQSERDEGDEGDTESETSTRETTQPLSSTGRDTHDQLQGDLESFFSTVSGKLPTHSTAADARVQSGPCLADLSPDKLELQLKYAFFHVNHEDIDLNQPAVCLSCLQSGHTESNCPEVTCIHCSAQHSSRLCPLLQRCSTCRDRGHTAKSCPTGLKVTTIPCDICGTSGHLEQACPQRFLPSYGPSDSGPTKLWISCCICASTSHLVGDCPRVNKGAATRWSLKLLAPEQIVNLTLEPSTKQREKETANRGLRPEGLKIKGRAAPCRSARIASAKQQFDTSDSDEQFLKPRIESRGNANRGSLTFATRLPKDPFPPPSTMPKKVVLTRFLAAINQQRQAAGNSQLELVYDNRANASFIDHADPQNSRLISGNQRQIEVIHNWWR